MDNLEVFNNFMRSAIQFSPKNNSAIVSTALGPAIKGLMDIIDLDSNPYNHHNDAKYCAICMAKEAFEETMEAMCGYKASGQLPLYYNPELNLLEETISTKFLYRDMLWYLSRGWILVGTY